MSYAQPQKTYGLAASNDDIPLSLGSSTLARPLPSSIQTRAIVSSNGAQQASGMISLQIPVGSGTGYLKSCSMYLRAKVTAAGTPGTTTWSFSGPLHSAANVIRQCTVSLGNQVVETVQNYGLWHDSLLAHTSSANYLNGDAALQQYASATKLAIPVANSVYVNIPVIANIFNGQKAVPLFLLNSPIFIQFDLETALNALTGAGAAITGYTVDEVQLVYDHISVDESYKSAVRASMADGRLFQLNMNNVLSSKVARSTGVSSTTLTYNIGVNMSSVKAVLYALSVDPAAYTDDRYFASGTFDTSSDFVVLLDGQRMNNMRISDAATAYSEMNKCFGNLNDPSQTFALANATIATTQTAYTTQAFLGGVNCTRFNELLAMAGSPAQNIQFSLSATSNTLNLVYYFIIYETILTIDNMGNAVLIR